MWKEHVDLEPCLIAPGTETLKISKFSKFSNFQNFHIFKVFKIFTFSNFKNFQISYVFHFLKNFKYLFRNLFLVHMPLFPEYVLISDIYHETKFMFPLQNQGNENPQCMPLWTRQISDSPYKRNKRIIAFWSEITDTVTDTSILKLKFLKFWKFWKFWKCENLENVKSFGAWCWVPVFENTPSNSIQQVL
jgi:hypothetical protein